MIKSLRDKEAEKIYQVEYVVDWGLKHRDLSDITAIGVDEIQWSKGHKYLTVVYQIDSGRIRLFMDRSRSDSKDLSSFFQFLGEERFGNLKYVCSDRWKPYLDVIKRKASQAINIRDRFHIVAKLNKAIDEVRADEYRKLLRRLAMRLCLNTQDWFRAKKQFSSGMVEGLNTKVKLTIRKSYGFRTFKAVELALYHTLGNYRNLYLPIDFTKEPQ